VTTNLALRAGRDIDYHTGRQGGGHVGGVAYYYGAAGEPPGQWAGKGAAALGLSGEVDPVVIRNLFHGDVTPDGEVLPGRKTTKRQAADEESAVAGFLVKHPFASATELAEVRASARSKTSVSRPYFDFALGAAKSVSVLHISLLVSARRARERGDPDAASVLEEEAGKIETALYETARTLVRHIEDYAAYTRTGHHSGATVDDRRGTVRSGTGEWRDTAGVIAPVFVQHTSHSGDPHLHAHVTVQNRVQRADREDEKYRTLDSRTLYSQRLGLAVLADREMETRMTALGWPMKTRADGNGAEVDGVPEEIIDMFSSRRASMRPEVEKITAEYREKYGHDPTSRERWQMQLYAWKKTRAALDAQHQAEPADQLAAWEQRVTSAEVSALETVPGKVRAANQQVPVVTEEDKGKAARIAAAEVQCHHATWSKAQLMFEVGRALPVMEASADSKALVTEVADLALSGLAGTEVVQATAPDVTNVASLGVRESDHGSIFRPPHEERYVTLPHLDTEETILRDAKTPVRQLVSEPAARAAVAESDLNAEQAGAVVKMLTADVMTTPLLAPAGSGKTHTMATFAKLWYQFTGRKVIGLALSENAARVMQEEMRHAGVEDPAAYNIAAFLGKTKGSDVLRRPVPLHENDVLVLDEATQTGTYDLALVQAAGREAGARLNPVGDTEQLGSPEAGGMFRLLTQEVPTAELSEIRRFEQDWEADSSVRLRSGDFSTFRAYDSRGRIRGADQETAFEQAAGSWLADHLRGKETLLLAGSNEEAADLASRVQARLVKLGAVHDPSVPLSDANFAGVGDLVRARLNTYINAGGRRLTNRDTLRVTRVRERAVEAVRKTGPGQWSKPFSVPKSYLASDAELDYAGNTAVAQGRTVDTGHLLVSETLSRPSFYVGMSRGRESNTAHVSTGPTAPKGHQPYEQATAEAVVRGVMQREPDDLSAIEHIRASQEWAGGSGHLVNLWSHAARSALYPEIDRMIKENLTEAEGYRYDREYSRQVLQNKLREYHLAGHDVPSLIQQITDTPLDGARSVSSVLHSQLTEMAMPDSPGEVTWADRTPARAPKVAHHLASALDHRQQELGERQADRPEPWLSRYLRLEPGASDGLREDYVRRAGLAASYREAAGRSGRAGAG
jgi:AAA domain-containing protein/TrwC relaxase